LSSGVERASKLHLPRGPWATVLDCLCAQFVAIGRDVWLERIKRGRVLDENHAPIAAGHRYREGLCIYYFREVPFEAPIPFSESVVYIDEHLLVADKPHFLPVQPAGAYVEQTLLTRLTRRFDNIQLTPLHRIDRLTAGLVLFSTNAATRAIYQSLFLEQKIKKYYQAIAPPLPHLDFPLRRATRLTTGAPFFRMCEIAGAPNSETHIEVCEQGAQYWRYGLTPITGKKHQLRVHMAALGAAIANDPLYPLLRNEAADDYTRPLKLLAKQLAFIDPLTGIERNFVSGFELAC
jgi:tRNA pseudouridine32 synthase / 23S rRNA pseudouridine746 synthase